MSKNFSYQNQLEFKAESCEMEKKNLTRKQEVNMQLFEISGDGKFFIKFVSSFFLLIKL